MKRAFTLLDDYMADGAVPGAAAVLVQRCQTVGAHYTGLADAVERRPVREDALYCGNILTRSDRLERRRCVG